MGCKQNGILGILIKRISQESEEEEEADDGWRKPRWFPIV